MDLVGGDRLPLPAPADDDPQVTLTPHHPAGHICADRRVVDRFRRKGPDVLDLVADGAEVAGQRALEHEAGVVRPDHDAHRVSLGCFMTPTGSGLHDGVDPRSRGPTGVVGCTSTTGIPSAAARSTSCSATYLDCLYDPKRWSTCAWEVSSTGAPIEAPWSPRVPTVEVYTTRSHPALRAASRTCLVPVTLTA